MVDIAAGKRLGGRRDGAQAPAEVARDADGKAEGDEQRQHADGDAGTPGRALERDETLVGLATVALGLRDVPLDGGEHVVGGGIRVAGDGLLGVAGVAALDGAVELVVEDLPRVDRAGDACDARGGAALTVGLAQGGDGLLGGRQVSQLVRARLAAREDHRGLGEVEVGKGRLGPLGDDDARDHALGYAVVRLLEALHVVDVHGDDRGRQGQDHTEAEAELTDRRTLPSRGMRRGAGTRIAGESVRAAPP